MNAPAIVPAATVVLMRPRTGQPPEVLMVERASQMAFAGGAMVFPGGRVDPGDMVLAARAGAVDLDPADAAARIAAIRETIEEVGIAIGILPAPDAATIAEVRAALADGRDFAAIAADHRWTFDLTALAPFARWRPNFPERRNFDTRFYIAEAPDGAHAIADGGECVRAIWIGAAEAIDEHAQDRLHLIFPTRRNLERIALHADHAALVADSAGREARLITPWVEKRADGEWLCIPDDLGYPVTAEPLESARRA